MTFSGKCGCQEAVMPAVPQKEASAFLPAALAASDRNWVFFWLSV